MKETSVKYRCTTCGHIQKVIHLTDDEQRGAVYAGSAAQWCNACQSGKPEPLDPQSDAARLEAHRKRHSMYPNGRPESNVERQLRAALDRIKRAELEVSQALAYVDRIVDRQRVEVTRETYEKRNGPRLRAYTMKDARADARTAAAGIRRAWEILDPRA